MPRKLLQGSVCLGVAGVGIQKTWSPDFIVSSLFCLVERVEVKDLEELCKPLMLPDWKN